MPSIIELASKIVSKHASKTPMTPEQLLQDMHHISLAIITTLFLFSVTSAHATDLNNGLVGHWTFDNCDAVDSSGNGYDGVIVGNIKCDNAVSGLGFQFDGSTYVSINDFPLNANGRTISLWIKQDTDGGSDIISKHNEYSDVEILLRGNGQFYNSELTIDGRYYDLSNPDSNSWSSQKGWSSELKQTGQFDMISETFDGSTIKFYINEELKFNRSANGSIVDNNWPLTIGAFSSCPECEGYLKAIVDDVRVYNHALSYCDIMDLHRSSDACSSGWCSFPDFSLSGQDIGGEGVYQMDIFADVPLYLNSKCNGKYGYGACYYQCTEYAARYLNKKYSTNYTDVKDIANNHTQGFQGYDFSPKYGINSAPTVKRSKPVDGNETTEPITLIKTDMPESGDIAIFHYVDTHGNLIDHTAVVKAVCGATVTLAEQNWISGGKYIKNRQISTSFAGVKFYRFPVTTVKGSNVYYTNVQDAYSSAESNGQVVQLQNLTYTENLNLNKNISVVLQGGYSSDLLTRLGQTTIFGSLKINSGKVVADRICIR